MQRIAFTGKMPGILDSRLSDACTRATSVHTVRKVFESSLMNHKLQDVRMM